MTIRDFPINKLFNYADDLGFGGYKKYINIWIEYTNRLMLGRDYIESLKLNTLYYTLSFGLNVCFQSLILTA